MEAYSKEFRRKVLRACDAGGGTREVARVAQVGVLAYLGGDAARGCRPLESVGILDSEGGPSFSPPVAGATPVGEYANRGYPLLPRIIPAEGGPELECSAARGGWWQLQSHELQLGLGGHYAIQGRNPSFR